MKRFLMLLAVACALSMSVSAGQIPSDGLTSSTPDGTDTSSTQPGDIPSGGLSYEIADSALDLIQMLIGVGI
jgi:hypothetical protein